MNNENNVYSLLFSFLIFIINMQLIRFRENNFSTTSKIMNLKLTGGHRNVPVPMCKLTIAILYYHIIKQHKREILRKETRDWQQMFPNEVLFNFSQTSVRKYGNKSETIKNKMT